MTYPYFIHPAVKALREGVENPEEERRLRRIVAANVGHLPSLRLMLGIDPEEFASFYPDLAAPALSTDDTISSFLSHFGKEGLPLPHAASEIAATLEERGLDSETTSVTVETVAEPVPQTQPLAPTEQNAYLLIKKRDYQGALEIITQLSLNIPEKSVYFADQIRFLKKLILNEARKSM